MELGATVVAAPLDVGDAGRMAVLQDPTGAVFAVWEARAEHRARRDRRAGRLLLGELMAKDLPRSATFYKSLFGWGTKRRPALHRVDARRPLDRRHDRDPEGLGNVPPHWLVYFQVDDCDASSAEKARAWVQGHDGPAGLPRRRDGSLCSAIRRARPSTSSS
jgi:predicted enzyme related to lactoylglutathione lyase